MSGKLEFMKKLSQILEMARQQDNHIEIKEVEEFFEEDHLSEEQMDLVCEYLLSEKVAVIGYVKEAGTIEEIEEEEKHLTQEEQNYLCDYLASLNESRTEDSSMIKYLLKVAEMAQELYCPDIFIGDLIQEGNVSLILALEKYKGAEEEEKILSEIRSAMEVSIAERNETLRRDKSMVGKVQRLDEQLKNLTEEMGRKVSIDELAEHAEITEDEIKSILSLAGEDAPEDEDDCEEE